MDIDVSKLTRLTIVDENGRVYERWGLTIGVSVQDEGKTLKVFVKKNPNITLPRVKV